MNQDIDVVVALGGNFPIIIRRYRICTSVRVCGSVHYSWEGDDEQVIAVIIC